MPPVGFVGDKTSILGIRKERERKKKGRNPPPLALSLPRTGACG
jgi:hypothetical protein